MDASVIDPVDVDDDMLNPLTGRVYGSDGWGYRRLPIPWTVGGDGLPSPSSGLTRWTQDPREAVRAAELGGRLRQCE